MSTDRTDPPSAAGAPSPQPDGRVDGQVAGLVAGPEPASGVELLDFAQTLSASSNLAEFEARFIAGFGQLFDVPMYALYILDPWTGRPHRVAAAGVSDAFLARYERVGRELDSLQAHLHATGGAAYNMALMESMDEWLKDPLYTKVKYLHDIRHEVQAPIVNRDGIIGSLHYGTDDPSRGFTPYEVRLTEALGRVAGTVIEGIHARANLERERDQAVAALDRTGVAVVTTDPVDPEPRLNAAARRLLAEVVDRERVLHRVIARPGADRDFSRHVDVELVEGGTGLLHGHSSRIRAEGGALITVLDLQSNQSEISAETLMALTSRERDVARFAVDGLSDREIADRLSLSHHTVSQYIKRIYRKLDVGSRVALTRLLLGLPQSRPE
jgi:DNA-binding CsgD family transcriptional regulator